MKKKVLLGYSNFKDLIEQNVYFVDKTLFVKDFFEYGSKASVLPRPRRFGKTLNISMLRYFFDNKESSKELFDGLKISQDKEFCNKYMNKYPLIYISFKDIKKDSWEKSFELLKEVIQKEYKRHLNILESLDDNERKYYERVINSPKESDLDTSLLELCKFLEKHYKQKVIVLIDEYDATIHKAYANKYYKEAITFFKTFYGSILKDNDYLYKGLMTGILRVSKESMFSGLNNVDVISILSKKYSQYFGFTEEEAFTFAKTYNIETKGMKDWYNGYRIGDNMIYNPWSVINCISNEGELKEYWVNTSSNDLIYKLAKIGSKEIKENLIYLLQGFEIETKIKENVSLKDKDLEEGDNFLYLLLFAGYLTWTKKDKNEDEELIYSLALPNKEVKLFVKDILAKISQNINELNEMLRNIEREEWDKFKENFEKEVKRYFSYYDVVNKESESFYHAFVMGMLINLNFKYEMKSNRESGIGRYDLAMLKNDRSIGIIFEFKRADNSEEIEDIAKKALEQIEAKDYGLDFGNMKVKKIGIAFKGKEAKVIYN